MDKSHQFIKKKEKILEKIDDNIENYDKTVEYLGDVGEVIKDLTLKIILHRDKLNVQRNIVQTGNVKIITPVLGGTLSAYDDIISRDYEYSRQLRTHAQNYASKIISLQSGSTTISFMDGLTASGAIAVAQGFDNREATEPFILELNESSPTEKKKILISLLKNENEAYADCIKHIDSAWDLLAQTTNKDRFIHIGQSLRQFMDKLLGHLAPNDNIQSLPSYQPGRDDGKGPSRSQRARYAIQGTNNIINEDDLRVIDEIIKSTSSEFDKLSKLAKERKVGDIDAYARRVINDVQILFINLLEARGKYFRD